MQYFLTSTEDGKITAHCYDIVLLIREKVSCDAKVKVNEGPHTVKLFKKHKTYKDKCYDQFNNAEGHLIFLSLLFKL